MLQLRSNDTEWVLASSPQATLLLCLLHIQKGSGELTKGGLAMLIARQSASHFSHQLRVSIHHRAATSTGVQSCRS